MAVINLSSVMDAIADAVVPTVTKRAYAWPVDSITVPCVVVGYPEELDFDMTFVRGSDRAVFPVYFVVGRATDRVARDQLSAVISGASGIKEVLDTSLSEVAQASRTTDCKITTMSVAGVEYIAAVFSLEVYT